MTYLFSQVLVLLIVAALAGLIVGFLMRSLFNGPRRAQAAEQDRQMRKLRAERDDTMRTNKDLTQERSELLTRVSDGPTSETDELTVQELTAAQEQLDLRNTELTVARRELADMQQRFNDLQGLDTELEGASSLAGRIPDLERQLADLQVEANRARALHQEVGTVANAHAELPEPNPATSDRLDALEHTTEVEASTLQDRIDNLRQRIGRLQGGVPQPGNQDDLTQISGVGNRVAGLLNNRGIFRFEQLAALEDSEIDNLDADLGEFTGRIRRDNWVLQARELRDRALNSEK